MAKELSSKAYHRLKIHKRRKKGQPDAALADAQNLLAGLNQQVGNRAVMRWIRRQQVTGELAVHGFSMEQVRQAGIHLAMKTPAIQRQADEAELIELEAGPVLKDTGQVAIQEVQTERYSVSGATLQEAAAGLDPQEWGRCRWLVDYDYETANGKVSKINLTLKITIRMPVWADYENASPAAKAEWDRMTQALQTHEDGHAEIARKWAPQIKERMLGQKAGNLKKAYQQALKDLEDESKKFDDDTQHGQNQGVTLDTSIP